MHDQRVGIDHVHGPPHLRQAVAEHQLRRADIGEDRHVRRRIAQLPVEPARGAALDGDALRADRKSDAESLGRLGEIAVDARRPFRPAGHRRDQQRRCEPAAEKLRRQVDLGQRDLRQRDMFEDDLRQAAVGPPRRQRGMQHDVEMIALARGDVAGGRCVSWDAHVTLCPIVADCETGRSPVVAFANDRVSISCNVTCSE